MIGKTLGSFLIESKLGSGAMGEVFRAKQTLKSGEVRTAAVKVISSDFALRDNSLDRFKREADILSQLRHPNIVRYYAHGKHRGTWYYAMEFVDGKTLDQVLEKREFLPWQEVMKLGIQLCRALQYAHEHQVVHRDLKPSNLMITKEGLLKLTDFGIAKDLEATQALTKTGRTLGTAAYMAPEQIKGTPAVSHKTDLYALGCLLYEMLTGQPPYQGKSAMVLMHAHISEPIPRASSKTPDVPRALDDLIVRLMQKEPPERPWDAQEVEQALLKLHEKMEAGKPVEMAFDRARAQVSAESITVSPSMAPSLTSGTQAQRDRGSGTRKKSKDGGGVPKVSRRAVETGLLVTALAGILAFMGYMFWPPSQEYYYEHAVEMMKSPRRVDWRRAEQDYMDVLDQRFPNHPYKQQLQEWRDQIALNAAEERALRLTGSGLGSRALNFAEELYQKTERAAQPLAEREQYALAVREWGLYVGTLKDRNDPDERGWLLLGQAKQKELETQLQVERETARRLLEQAAVLMERGQLEVARELLEKMVSEYAGATATDAAMLPLLQEAGKLLDASRSPAPGKTPGTPSNDETPEAEAGDRQPPP